MHIEHGVVGKLHWAEWREKKTRVEWSVDFDYCCNSVDDYNCDRSYWHDHFLSIEAKWASSIIFLTAIFFLSLLLSTVYMWVWHVVSSIPLAIYNALNAIIQVNFMKSQQQRWKKCKWKIHSHLEKLNGEKRNDDESNRMARDEEKCGNIFFSYYIIFQLMFDVQIYKLYEYIYKRARFQSSQLQTGTEKEETEKKRPKYNYQSNLLELVALFNPLELLWLDSPSLFFSSFSLFICAFLFASFMHFFLQLVDSVTLKKLWLDSKIVWEI